MAQELRQKLSEQKPVDFNFGPSLNEGDNVASVTVTVPTNITEVVGHRIVSGQVVQPRFNISAATVGNRYTVKVQATSTAGDVVVLDLDILPQPD